MTLLELIIVLALLGLLTGLVAPRVGRWLDNWRLRSAAERLAQTIRYARLRALYEQRYYLVEIRPKEKRIQLREPLSGFVREYTLPSDIQVGEDENTPFASEWRLIIPPSGTLEEKTLWLRNRQGKEWKIHLNFLLGAPEVEVARQGA